MTRSAWILSAALLAPAPARAGAAGTSAFEFLAIDVGPRQAAMGGAAVAAGDGLFGALANPAVLGRLWRREADFLYTRWFEGVDYQFLGYAHPHAGLGTFSAAFHQLDYGEIQGFDAGGARTGELKAGDRLALLGYGRSVLPNVWAGVHAKVVQETLDSESASAYAADAGLLYRPELPWPRVSAALGLAVRHLGTRPRFVRESAPLPRTVEAGLAVRPYFEGLTFAVDAGKTREEDVVVQAGGEYWLKDLVAFRLGYDSARDIGNGLGFGFGVKFRQVQVDYAFSSFGDLGATHHAAVAFRFGGLAETHYERGMKLMREEDYARAIIEFSRSLSLDHRHERAILRIKEANELLQERLRKLDE